MDKLELTGFERFWYYLACVLSLGGVYMVKVACKTALIEIDNQKADIAAAQFFRDMGAAPKVPPQLPFINVPVPEPEDGPDASEGPAAG